MKVKCLLSLLLTMLITYPGYCREAQDKEWYPFVLSEEMDPDSPANIGKLVLDPPAGKHGFLRSQNGHFYFEDGTRAKFWGTNLCFSACFPDHKEAEILADRLAFFGFNAVRLHHMDMFFEPRGIFRDAAPAYKDRDLKETGMLSEKQLDKLDYFVFQLKQKGIYVDINLLVTRRFTGADGVFDAEKLGMAAKPFSLFDPILIDLQKKYAKGLLTHYNPYTNLTYSDDPAIALIEITNENSIFPHWKWNRLNGPLFGLKKDSIPDYYVKQLDELWNKWLKTKYKTVENVKKAWSLVKAIESEVLEPGHPEEPDNGKNTVDLGDLSNWQLEKHDKAEATVKIKDNKVTMDIQKFTETPWHLQFKATQIKVSKDKKYLVTFKISSEKETKVAIVAQQAFEPWQNVGLQQEVYVFETPRVYTIPFSPTMDCHDTKVGFIAGFDTGNIVIEDIKFEEIDSLSFISDEKDISDFTFNRPIHKFLNFYPSTQREDIRQFYVDLEKDYFSQMIIFLKAECGVKIPVTGIGGYDGNEDIEAQGPCDFVDAHAYWDHPRFPNNNWDKNDFRIHNKSMLADKRRGIIGVITDKFKDAHTYWLLNDVSPKPFTITEWNHCYPNEYAYETPVLLAAYAVKNNWDGLFQFAYDGMGNKPDEINSYFDIMNNPQKLILCAVGSLLYLKSDSVSIESLGRDYSINSSFVSGVCGVIKESEWYTGPLKVTPEENGAIFLYSTDGKAINKSENLVLTALNGIRNADSGWGKVDIDRYSWGHAPTLLKYFTITAGIKDPIQVYIMDRNGSLRQEIKTGKTDDMHMFTNQMSAPPWLFIHKLSDTQAVSDEQPE